MQATNSHRQGVGFKVDELVFLRFQPYRQHTLARYANQKFPSFTRIHSIFHVSLL